ncbi:anti-sigma regulatory factor (Ser/Thr protein kinase) [Bacillus mesophilus]|uniref:ATP-binding protein n=1 Tax=Bacillus mesophilus TaxID=1808955 RepID=A0A6M0Q8K4_9BACI|nr:anti-sigma regulatory factor (Ser/Thr protein kinase) [Bacillus mesophilus]NEY72692.1 ATP-binding protein [Bacillus mesophilus]
MEVLYSFSTYSEFQEKLDEVEQYLDRYAKNKKKYAMFSIIEAVNNVFEHANKAETDLCITLTLIFTKNQLIIESTHNGEEFNYKKKLEKIGDPDIYFQNHLTALRGRGIAIMKKCADNLQYFDNGRRITLTFQLLGDENGI